MEKDSRIERVEALQPGMMVISGPYAVNSRTPGIATSEKAYAVRELKQQRLTDPKAKLVVVGRFAWVLRTAEGWKKDRSSEAFKSDHGIKAWRGAKA
jgi:hypothetical protein